MTLFIKNSNYLLGTKNPWKNRLTVVTDTLCGSKDLPIHEFFEDVCFLVAPGSNTHSMPRVYNIKPGHHQVPSEMFLNKFAPGQVSTRYQQVRQRLHFV